MNAAGWTISIIGIGIALLLALQVERRGRTRSAAGPGDRLEFMSPPWIAMARREITTALAGTDLDRPPFTLSEEFTDPPPHLGHGAPTIGFSVRVGDGRVEVGGTPEPGADLRIVSDYADALAVARDPDAAAGDTEEVERRVAAGRLRVEGDPSGAPPALLELDVHRLLAGRTA